MAARADTLERRMTRLDGLFLTLACLSPAIGVFIVGSSVVHQVAGGVVACFLAALLLGAAMAPVYAELGSAFPNAGGEYTMAARVLGPGCGFAVLAVNLAGLCAAFALAGLGAAEYLRVMAPGLPPVPTAMALLAAMTLLALLNTRTNALVSLALLAGEVAALATTGGLGLLHVHGDLLARLLHPVVTQGGAPVRPVALAGLGVAAAGAVYAFNGFGSVVLFGEEIRDARRSVSTIVYWALAIGALTELLPILGMVAGAGDLARLSASDTPILDFVRQAGGPSAARLTGVAVAGAVLNAMLAVILLAARQLYASARDGCWPAAVAVPLARIHPRFRTPHVATLAAGGIGLICSLAPLGFLVTVLANGSMATYATLCVAAIAGRRNGATTHSQAPMKAFPAPPVAALALLCAVLLADLLDPSAGLPGLAVTAALFAAGAAYYHWGVRGRRDWTPSSPGEEPVP